ncbi:MAG: hypothetical protein AAFP90_10685 [Planctomycetota bacterium]
MPSNEPNPPMDPPPHESRCDHWHVYYDDGGTRAWCSDFEAHLRDCSSCQQQIARMSQWDNDLRSDAAESTPAFHWEPPVEASTSATDRCSVSPRESRTRGQNAHRGQQGRYGIAVRMTLVIAIVLLIAFGFWSVIRDQEQRVAIDKLQRPIDPDRTQETASSRDGAISAHASNQGFIETNNTQSPNPDPVMTKPAIVQRISAPGHFHVQQQQTESFTFVMLHKQINPHSHSSSSSTNRNTP